MEARAGDKGQDTGGYVELVEKQKQALTDGPFFFEIENRICGTSEERKCGFIDYFFYSLYSFTFLYFFTFLHAACQTEGGGNYMQLVRPKVVAMAVRR